MSLELLGGLGGIHEGPREGPSGARGPLGAPGGPHGGPRGPLMRPGGRFLGPGGPRTLFRGLSEAPRVGVTKSVGGPGGPILGPGPLTNHQNRLEKCVFERNRVFRVGPAADAEKSRTDSRSDGFLGGSKMKGHGPKGPPEALSGRSKGPTLIDKMGLGSRRPQNVWFSLGNKAFSKNRQSAPGGPPGRFSRVLGSPRRARGPPGGFLTFSGGVPGPLLGSGAKSRGGPGGPREPLFWSRGAVSSLWGGPEMLKNYWFLM